MNDVLKYVQSFSKKDKVGFILQYLDNLNPKCPEPPLDDKNTKLLLEFMEHFKNEDLDVVFEKVFKKGLESFDEDNYDFRICFQMALTHASIGGNVKKSEKYFEQIIILLCKKMSSDSEIEFNNFPFALKCIEEYYVRPKIKNDSKEETIALIMPLLNLINKKFVYDNLKQRSKFFSFKSLILIRLGMHEKALKSLRKCLKMYRDLKCVASECVHLFYIAVIHERMGNHEMAIKTHEMNRNINFQVMEQPLDSRQTQVFFQDRSLYRIGKLMYLKGDYEECHNTLTFFVGLQVEENRTNFDPNRNAFLQDYWWQEIVEDPNILMEEAKRLIEKSNLKNLENR